MTKDELFEETYALGIKARKNGLTDEGNNLLLTALADLRSDADFNFELSRQDVSGMIQRLARAAKANGLEYTAWNLAYVGIALMVGEESEVELGTAMAPLAKTLKERFVQGDFYWPEDFEG
jgi:hypothetical protein